MPNLVQTYALHDTDPQGHGGAIRINRKDAHKWNSKGYGIFHTVNEFHGRRILANLVFINSWYVDIDKISKEEMIKLIATGLVPTMVVETKNGYHVYWKAKNATKESWRQIMELRLIPFYKGDRKAKDLTRILRTPGFNHMKNPEEPFPVKVVFYKHVEYSEDDMFKFYKDLKTQKKQKDKHTKAKKEFPMSGDFWENVWNLDCEDALSKLSGTSHVGGETYEFKINSGGTKQIYVNGKSSSSWIDENQRIGSLDNGGPTIAQWLNWFHKDYRKTVQIIEEVFPQCKKTNQMNLL